MQQLFVTFFPSFQNSIITLQLGRFDYISNLLEEIWRHLEDYKFPQSRNFAAAAG